MDDYQRVTDSVLFEPNSSGQLYNAAFDRIAKTVGSCCLLLTYFRSVDHMVNNVLIMMDAFIPQGHEAKF